MALKSSVPHLHSATRFCHQTTGLANYLAEFRVCPAFLVSIFTLYRSRIAINSPGELPRQLASTVKVDRVGVQHGERCGRVLAVTKPRKQTLVCYVLVVIQLVSKVSSLE